MGVLSSKNYYIQVIFSNSERVIQGQPEPFIGKANRANIESPIMSRSSSDVSRVDVNGLRRGWIMCRYIGSAPCCVVNIKTCIEKQIAHSSSCQYEEKQNNTLEFVIEGYEQANNSLCEYLKNSKAALSIPLSIEQNPTSANNVMYPNDPNS